MDKQLKSLKKQYESEINTTFTEKDKKAVLAKIKDSNQPKRRNYLPKLIPVAALAALFIIVAISINSIPDLFTNMRNSASDNSVESQDNSAMTMEMDGASEEEGYDMDSPDVGIAQNDEHVSENSDGDQSGDFQSATDDRDISSDGSNILFDPESVEVGLTYGNMQVTDVRKQEDETLITFKGDTWLSGDFYYSNDKIAYNPDNRTLLEFPLARSDKNGDIPFYFQDESTVKVMYGAARGGNPIDQTGNGFMLDVIGAEYVYSPSGSTVNLEIRNTLEVTKESYATSIALNDSLQDIYSKYAETLDDSLLQGLKPIDVFKLYQHAHYNNHEDVLYALYIEGELYGTPDKETYFDKRSMYEANQQQINDLYSNLQRETTFEEIYMEPDGEERAFIMFPSEEGHWPNSFSLVKDKKQDVWKVYLLPLN